MPQPDFEGARRYALERLTNELSPLLLYHSVAHTRDDVAPASQRLAEMEGVPAEDLTLLLTGAYFHDIGFIVTRDQHEQAGIAIAREVLPGFGYEPAHLAVIEGLLLATRLPQTPHTRLEAILADADLDVLGRDDFWERQVALREEWAAFGQQHSDEAWYRSQLAFQRRHEYFTQAARRLRSAQKQANIERLVATLRECGGDHKGPGASVSAVR